jgi:FkbM family methyltransferase
VQRLLAALNRLPIGVRAVRFGEDRLYADSLDRWIAATAWRLGWLEGGERALIRRDVRPGMVAIDVGANLGCHTLTLARAVGPGGRVHALEPDPRNFRMLERAVTAAGLAQVRLHRAAATATPGEAILHLGGANRGDHRLGAGGGRRATVRVAGVVLDDLLAGEARVDFVKIDVQGAEVGVLRGLARTLARSPGVRVLCELSPALLADAGHDATAFFAPLAAAGLRPHLLGRGGAVAPVTPEAAWAAAVRAGYVNLYFVDGP